MFVKIHGQPVLGHLRHMKGSSSVWSTHVIPLATSLASVLTKSTCQFLAAHDIRTIADDEVCTIVGISVDSPENHLSFLPMHRLVLIEVLLIGEEPEHV